MVSETDDPIAALSDKKIATRSAGARDLSLSGELSHIPLLLEKAHKDRSPAVRLLTCTAAADILSRHRVGTGAESMSTAIQDEVLIHLNRLDPGLNTAMFSVLACLDLPMTMQRLSVGMRDPRGNVRLGAAVGMWRHVMSRAQWGNESLEKSVTDLISDGRLPPDSLAELARICAAGGYRSAIPALSSLDLVGIQAELVDACIEVLDSMEEPGLGCWWSDGRDAGEVGEHPSQPPGGLLLTTNGALMGSQVGWSWIPKNELDWRCMYLRRVGQAEPDFVLQGLERTWFRQDSAILDMVDLAMDVPRIDVQPKAHVEGERARHLIGPLLPDNSDGDRARGLLSLAAGDLEHALNAFDAAIDGKKPAPDTWFLQGETRFALGDEEGARESWNLTQDKARRKKDWQVQRARKRLS